MIQISSRFSIELYFFFHLRSMNSMLSVWVSFVIYSIFLGLKALLLLYIEALTDQFDQASSKIAQSNEEDFV
jgi:hypothetical protein